MGLSHDTAIKTKQNGIRLTTLDDKKYPFFGFFPAFLQLHLNGSEAVELFYETILFFLLTKSPFVATEFDVTVRNWLEKKQLGFQQGKKGSKLCYQRIFFFREKKLRRRFALAIFKNRERERKVGRRWSRGAFS
jgi:hypothetical protein